MTSGFVDITETDLDDVFSPLILGVPKAHNVQYYVQGVDISNRFYPLDQGAQQTHVTGYEWHGQDLNEIFGIFDFTVTYRFLNPGTDAILPVNFSTTSLTDPDSGGPFTPAPPFMSMGQSPPQLYTYPGGLNRVGTSSDTAISWVWIDQVILPDSVQTTLSDLWSTLDPNAIPALDASVVDFDVTVMSGGAALSANGTCTGPVTSPDDYIQFIIDGGFAPYWVDAEGNTHTEDQQAITDIDSFWAVQTANLKAAGLYTGINQAALFPLFTSFDVTCTQPASYSGIPTGACAIPTIDTTTGAYSLGGSSYEAVQPGFSSPDLWCFVLQLGAPTVLIEKQIG